VKADNNLDRCKIETLKARQTTVLIHAYHELLLAEEGCA